jgi:adenylyltransferase/sulfurtransferase
VNRELIFIDVWDNVQRRIKIAPLLGKVDCPCCRHRRFEWLDGELGSHTTTLCGRNAVQVSHRTPARLNFEELAKQLGQLGEVSYNRFLLKFTTDGHEFTVFPDGRAIIKGTSDVDKARTLYAKYIGH